MRVLVAAAAVVVLCAAAAAVAAVVHPQPAPAARLALDADRALFGPGTARNLVPGQRRSACVGVTNAGAAAGRAALYASRIQGGLAPYLRLTVTRGRSCARFVADGVAFRGRLGEFPDELSEAVLEPAAWQPGERHAYRFTLELADDPGAAGHSARWDWRMAVESLPVRATAAQRARSATSRCDVVQLAGSVAGRTRTLTRVLRVRRRVRAVLLLRTYGSAGATRVVLTTGLRVGGDSALVVPDWADVRYRLNGERAVVSADRPFRARIAAAALVPGRNRISVAVQPRRGRKRVTAFTVRVTPAPIEGRTVCVVSA